MIENYISQTEASGYIIAAEYYEALIATEQENIDTLKQEQS